MSTKKQKRLREERRDLLKQRLPILHELYKDYVSTLPLNALRPDIGDVFLYPDINNLLSCTPEGEFTATSHVGYLRAMFPIITEQWKMGMERKLVVLYNEGCSVEGKTFDRTTLNLATTVFTCSNCYTFSASELTETIQYPRVMMHSCAFDRVYGYDRSSLEDAEILKAVTSRSVWNERGSISLRARNVRALITAVQLCGLDIDKTTAAEMDILDPIFECTTCNDHYKGRAMMRWSIVVSHFLFRPMSDVFILHY